MPVRDPSEELRSVRAGVAASILCVFTRGSIIFAPRTCET